MPTGKVLLVTGDDDLAVQLAQLLFDAGYEVLIARSGPAAIMKLAETDGLAAVIIERELGGVGLDAVLHAVSLEEDLMRVPLILVGQTTELPSGAWAAVSRENRSEILLLLNQLRE